MLLLIHYLMCYAYSRSYFHWNISIQKDHLRSYPHNTFLDGLFLYHHLNNKPKAKVIIPNTMKETRAPIKMLRIKLIFFCANLTDK